MRTEPLLLVLISLLCLFPVTYSLCCTAAWECSSITENYNYALCQSGECACLSNLGFDGSASPQDRCRCNSPKSVYWNNGTPYCLSFQESVETSAKLKRTERLKAAVTRVYQSLIYPTPTLILTGQISIEGLFSPTARGRVDPLGTFDSQATLQEYFYGLAVTPFTKAVAFYMKDLFGVDNEVFIRIDVTFRNSAGPVPFDYNLTETGRFKFDELDRIESADLIIHNIGKATDVPPEAHAGTIQSICGILVAQPGNCVQALDQEGYYTDFQDCVTFMSSIPYGSFDQAASNSVACRVIHALLTIFDPAVHCRHAGKTGGHKCIDTPYADYYLVDY